VGRETLADEVRRARPPAGVETTHGRVALTAGGAEIWLRRVGA
jgi:hypothetical protein